MPVRPAPRRYPVFALALLLLLLADAAPTFAQTLAFDWRDYDGKDLVSIVKNQGSCGSTYIFGPVAMVESRCKITIWRLSGQLQEIDFSEQYIMACGSGYFGDFDCDGGYGRDTLVHLRDIGAPYEPCYVYRAQDAPCPAGCVDDPGPLVLHTPVVDVAEHQPYWDDASLMNEIVTHGPVCVTMDVYEDFMTYDGGVYEHTTGDRLGGQAVLVIGWGLEPGTRRAYWICRNSWGTGWGEDGDFRIRRDASHAGCDFGYFAWTASVHVEVSATPGVPDARVLNQNVPNPFNPVTLIRYTPAADGHARLEVFDLAGRRVATLAEGDHEARREYRVQWDGRDDRGRTVPSGIYLYRFASGTDVEARRMVLLR